MNIHHNSKLHNAFQMIYLHKLCRAQELEEFDLKVFKLHIKRYGKMGIILYSKDCAAHQYSK